MYRVSDRRIWQMRQFEKSVARRSVQAISEITAGACGPIVAISEKHNPAFSDAENQLVHKAAMQCWELQQKRSLG